MKKILLFSFLILIGISSCTDKILDEIDTNPNRVNDAPLKTLLPQVEVSLVTRIFGSDAAIQTYYATEQNTFVLGGNALEGGGFGGVIWSNAYLIINDLNIIKQKSTAVEAWTYAGIADVLKAFCLSALVDMFGDIPYTQAFKSEFVNPSFDSAESIYPEIQNILDEAIANLEKTSGSIAPTTDDMFFNGNKSMWAKTAYGLKARLFNRMSNVDPQGSANNALSALSKSFVSDTENFTFTKFANTTQNGNPISNTHNSQPGSCIGNGIYNTMASYSPTGNVEDDPRAKIWFTRIGGKIIAAPNGTALPDFGEPRLDGARYSKPEIFKWRTAPMPILTFIELKFIEAEAQFRLNKKTEANTAYETAVSYALNHASSFNPAVALTAAQMNAYKALPKVYAGAANLTLKDIISQKYIFFYQFQSIETYNDIRRTGLIPITDPTGRPNRSIYPGSEKDRNTSTPTNIDQYSIFEASTKLFWAK